MGILDQRASTKTEENATKIGEQKEIFDEDASTKIRGKNTKSNKLKKEVLDEDASTRIKEKIAKRRKQQKEVLDEDAYTKTETTENRKQKEEIRGGCLYENRREKNQKQKAE